MAVGITGCTAKTNAGYAETTVQREGETTAETADIPFAEKGVEETDAITEDEDQWVPPASPELTANDMDIFEKAYPDKENTYYMPITVLGTQEKDGTIYQILFRTLPLSEDGQRETYTIGIVREDENGNVEVLATEETDILTDLDGDDWSAQPAAQLTVDEYAAFQNVLDTFSENKYTALTIISENDTGYLVLCREYAALDGNVYYAVAEINKKENDMPELRRITELTSEANAN